MIIWLLLFPALFRPVVSIIDPVGYYSWARSILIDGNWNVADEFDHYQIKGDTPTTPTGYLHNQWASGSALLWLPLMSLWHLAATVLSAFGLALPLDGYAQPYVWAASLTSAIAGLAAVLITYAILKKLFGHFTALLTALVIWLASPLVFYQYHQPLMSHANDALLFALFLLVWLQTRAHRYSPAWLCGLGIVIGCAAWIRTQNVILLAAVLSEVAWDFAQEVRSAGAACAVRLALRRLLPLLAGFAVPVVFLMLFWHEVYGSWVLNAYQATKGGSFDLRAPHLLQVLFSSDRGLIVWLPWVGLAILGFRWLYRRDLRLASLLTIIALMQLFIIASWSIWAGGDAFGPRFWVALMPLFGFGLAALVSRADNATIVRRTALSSVAALFIVWNFLLMFQYSLGIIAPSGPVDLGAMVRNQVVVISKISEQVLARLR